MLLQKFLKLIFHSVVKLNLIKDVKLLQADLN